MDYPIKYSQRRKERGGAEKYGDSQRRGGRRDAEEEEGLLYESYAWTLRYDNGQKPYFLLCAFAPPLRLCVKI